MCMAAGSPPQRTQHRQMPGPCAAPRSMGQDGEGRSTRTATPHPLTPSPCLIPICGRSSQEATVESDHEGVRLVVKFGLMTAGSRQQVKLCPCLVVLCWCGSVVEM